MGAGRANEHRARVAGVTVVVTEHFAERYRERVGPAPPAHQAAWLARTLATRRPRRHGGKSWTVKLHGSRHVAVLSRDGGVWVALTVK